VTVAVRRGDGEIEVEVADDGRGIAAGRRHEALAAGHIGLASLEQRVRSAGGSFELGAARGGQEGTGTRAVIRIPDAGSPR
jgi:signal transduction histidine kinase